MTISPEPFTVLLQQHRNGSETALDQLLPLVYSELRRLAQRQLRTQKDAHTLQPTALVHEAYLRLVDQQIAGIADRAHFQGLCARLMRQILVDRARRRNALRRGGGKAARLETAVEPVAEGTPGVDLLALDEAISRLTALDARKARVVELRIFAGLEVKEAAALLGVSERTVEADWFFARAWLRGQLADA
jgi:RNA polymerase sigma factor (TIGR02999 family)